jgi:hypothetical protein
MLVILLVVLTGLFGGLFATFSTAFYRTVRPVDGRTTETEGTSEVGE